jgi:hypothetical protein
MRRDITGRHDRNSGKILKIIQHPQAAPDQRKKKYAEDEPQPHGPLQFEQCLEQVALQGPGSQDTEGKSQQCGCPEGNRHRENARQEIPQPVGNDQPQSKAEQAALVRFQIEPTEGHQPSADFPKQAQQDQRQELEFVEKVHGQLKGFAATTRIRVTASSSRSPLTNSGRM